MPPPPSSPRATATDARFDALIAQYGHLIAAAIRRVGGATVAAEHDDIAQAVRVALWKRLADEQAIDHPASYVYKAAVRETVRAVARIRARQVAPLDDLPTEPPSRAADPDRLVASREQREALAEALRRLTPDRARAVRAHLAGLTVDELMHLRGWSYQRARNLIARGMADLRARLAERGWP
ncbi:MAG: sigma-70 family RNA polymerase sigma factor [Vicinamibacterales bacterium]